MVGEQQGVTIRWCWAVEDRRAAEAWGISRGLQTRKDEDIVGLAAAEDKALLRSNLSVVAVQWHGDAAHAGHRFFAQIMLLAQSGRSPPARPLRACLDQEVRLNRMSLLRSPPLVILRNAKSLS